LLLSRYLVRELDPPSPPELPSCAIVGAGRLGTALVAGLAEAGATVTGPLRRGEPVPAGVDVVLLLVPDAAIAAAAATVPPGPLVGHCSGATGLEVLGSREGFSLHPLMSVPAGASPAVLRGAGCAVDGSTPRALEAARRLGVALGMRPAHVAPADRVAYHAAGAMAANFLVALEAAAERLAATAGVTREQLAPLVLATAAQWAALGPEAALTGPIARGDELTVQRHRAAVAERTPELLALWDALAETTRGLAGRRARAS
jgi:predicted short-subunit dehydrogenase-like oxidoreductase (DUF2520 family)